MSGIAPRTDPAWPAWPCRRRTCASRTAPTPCDYCGGYGQVVQSQGIFRIQTRLVPLAAIGLALIMVGAVIYHLTRGEYVNIVMNVLNAALLAFIAWGRTTKVPLQDRPAAA